MSAVTPIIHSQSLMPMPEVWTNAYAEADQEAVRSIIEWLNDGQVHVPGFANQRTQTKLARAAKVNVSTLNSILAGKYPSSPSKWLDQVLDTLRRQAHRERDGVRELPFVMTSVYRVAQAACHRAHMYRNFGVISAYVGTGKTTAVKQYAREHASVILVEATPDMNAAVMLTELVEKTGAEVHKSNRYSAGTKAERMHAVIRALKGSDSLLILDEAETVTAPTLEYVRRISDKAGIGVVLSGTEKLKPMIKDPRGRFGQISSRVGFWPPIVQSITEEDANLLTRAGLSDDDVELTPAVLDAFWQMCDGSARVLANSLVPGVRDYGLKKGKALTPELVFRVGEELLGFKRPTARRG